MIGRVPVLEDALAAVFVGDTHRRYQRWIAEYDTLDERELAELAGASRTAHDEPPVVVVTPETDVAASLRATQGEFVVLVDSRVALRPHALVLVSQTLAQQPDATLVYADDDVLTVDGTRTDHYFKPDWNPALLRCQNYVGGFVTVQRDVAHEAAERVDGAGDDRLWHFLLELTARVAPETIHHLPYVLSQWRGARPAHALDPDMRVGPSRALEQRLAGLGDRIGVEAVGKASYQLRYAPPDDSPLVSIVVPTTCDLGFLRPCVEGVLERTSYRRLELLLVVNGSRCTSPDEAHYLAGLAEDDRVRIVADDERPYNFSKVNNRAVAEARGSLVCFLNDDTEVIGAEWLSEMVARVQQERVAAVGAKLVYPNGRIQHAGVIVGIGYVAGHAYARKRGDTRGYHDRALVDQDLSCVTAACMLIRRDVFLESGGFDEALAIAHNDVDLCLRLRDRGWRIVWTPAAQLFHRESASIGPHDSPERQREWAFELAEMRRRWGETLRRDPHYNPNLSLDVVEVWEPAFPPRVAYPWREVRAQAPDAAASTRPASLIR